MELEAKIQDTREYELGFLLKEEEGITVIRDLIARLGGSISFESEIRRIMLAYPIKKEQGAFFGFIYFSMLPEHTKELKHELQLASAVLRTLIVKDPIKKEYPSGGEGRGPRREEREEKKEVPAVTNEELEKKLEEILT